MPPQTRSRVTGVVKRIKYKDSIDLSDVESSSSVSRGKRGRSSKNREIGKDSDGESDFSASEDGNLSESVSLTESESQTEKTDGSPVSSENRKSFVTSTRPIKPSIARTGAEPKIGAMKLQSVSSTLLESSEAELRDAIVRELHFVPNSIVTVSYISRKLAILSKVLNEEDTKAALDLEMVNLLLSFFRRLNIPQVAAFFNLSCIGISMRKAANYFSRLQAICRDILAEYHQAVPDVSVVDPDVLKYNPEWIRSIVPSAEDVFIDHDRT